VRKEKTGNIGQNLSCMTEAFNDRINGFSYWTAAGIEDVINPKSVIMEGTSWFQHVRSHPLLQVL
jgi:hypothetical protein